MNISEFCKIYTGNGFPMEFQGKKDGKYPFYKVSDISASNAQQKIFLGSANNYIDEFDVSMLKGNIIPAGTIVFAKIGEALKLNKRAITSCECLIDNNVIGIKPDDNIINLLYFYYYLLKIDMIHYSESTTLPSVRKSTIEKIEVKIPPIDVQNKRVSILNLCHETIKYKVELLYNLELLVKSRFVELISKNKLIYQKVRLKDCCLISSGATPSRKNSDYWDENGINWFKTTELKNNFLIDSEEKISELGYEKTSVKLLPKHTVLIAMYGQGKTRGMTGYLLNNATTNQACAALISLDIINPKYLWYTMINSYDRLRNMAKGGTQPNLSVSSIKDFEIILPPIDIQNKFTNYIEQINKLKSDVQKSIYETQLLMDSLMQEYFG